MDPSLPLNPPSQSLMSQPTPPEDSAMTRAERFERDRPSGSDAPSDAIQPSPAKKIKLDDSPAGRAGPAEALLPDVRVKGVAKVKAE